MSFVFSLIVIRIVPQKLYKNHCVTIMINGNDDSTRKHGSSDKISKIYFITLRINNY